MSRPDGATAPAQHLVRITEAPIDVGRLITEMTTSENGAIAVFAGTVRGTNAGRRVLFLEYEGYAPMAERTLADIAEAMAREFGPCRVAIVHRVGREHTLGRFERQHV